MGITPITPNLTYLSFCIISLLKSWRIFVQALDPRVIKVAIEVDGKTNLYDGILIRATGSKYANSLQNEAEIAITNLDRITQDYILTQTSPFNLNRTPKTVRLYAGRQSYGTTLIYVGNIITASLSQPPDVTVTLRCLTGNFIKGTILARYQPGLATLSQIAKAVAQDTNTVLNFQASDKNISNYNFSGGALDQIGYLGQLGDINAFIDDDILTVKNQGIPITGVVRNLSAETGMIGIPEFTEQGIRVKYLLDNVSKLGGRLNITSVMYPAVNGSYVIYKLSFDISNRETPFYYIAEAARI